MKFTKLSKSSDKSIASAYTYLLGPFKTYANEHNVPYHAVIRFLWELAPTESKNIVRDQRLYHLTQSNGLHDFNESDELALSAYDSLMRNSYGYPFFESSFDRYGIDYVDTQLRYLSHSAIKERYVEHYPTVEDFMHDILTHNLNSLVSDFKDTLLLSRKLSDGIQRCNKGVFEMINALLEHSGLPAHFYETITEHGYALIINRTDDSHDG